MEMHDRNLTCRPRVSRVMPLSTRARIGLAIGLTCALASIWATTCGAETARHALASSLRSSFTPEHIERELSGEKQKPRPAPEISPANTYPQDGDDRPAANLNTTFSDLPPTPTKPRGLPNTSFVLLLGMDNRSDRLTGRSDTMIIAAFRHHDGKVAAFSVPRDLWIELPDLGPARINSTIRIGNHKLGPDRGIALMREVIKSEFGIRIDHYAAVDLAGFVDVVESVGGIDVDVPCPIMDCFWTGKKGEACKMLDLEAGRHQLDGPTALSFARSRHGRGDRDRTRRQQSVILALARKIRAGGLRSLPRLWQSAEPHVDTDLDLEAALYYASFALEIDLKNIGGFAITRPLVERHITIDDKHVLLLDRERFDHALGALFTTPLPALKPRKRCPKADVALAPGRHQ